MTRVCPCLLICSWPHLTLGQSSPPATFRANLQRTGVFETKGVSRLYGVKWKFKTGRVVEAWFSSPSVSGGVIYFGSDDGYLYALNAQTGELKWKFKTGGAGALSGATGEVRQTILGANGTGLFNIRFAFALKKEAPK